MKTLLPKITSGAKSISATKTASPLIANEIKVNTRKLHSSTQSTTPSTSTCIVSPWSKSVQILEPSRSKSLTNQSRAFFSYSQPVKTVDMPFHEGTIAKWRKNEGDLMTPGEVLVEIETCYTKTKQEFQYYDASPGYLAKILVQENSGKVELNRPICIVVRKKEDIATYSNFKPEQAASLTQSESGPTDTPIEEAPTGKKRRSKN